MRYHKSRRSRFMIKTIPFLAVVLAFSLIGCQSSPDGGSASESGLSSFELEHGIGPVTQPVSLGEVDAERRARGKDIFETKCESCHRLDNRLVGPALGDVLDRRSPEFVMNFILNPQEMIEKHPEGKKMLAEYMLVMPFQNVAEDEALDIVEYLRSIN
jgi:cytochrome c